MSYTLKNYENIKLSLNLVHKVDLVLALSTQLLYFWWRKKRLQPAFLYNKNVYHCVADNGVGQVIIQPQRKQVFSQRKQFGTQHYYTSCKIKN